MWWARVRREHIVMTVLDRARVCCPSDDSGIFEHVFGGRSHQPRTVVLYPRSMSATTPPQLPFTGNDEANRLLVEEPLAFLIGFLLDQQITVQQAFTGPFELKRRLGSLDARVIADMDPAELEATFRQRPAIHRFPASMARRTADLCRAIADDYDGRAEAVWIDARDGKDLERRLLGLPGIGEMKARTLIGILVRRFGVNPPGWEDVIPRHPTLADVDSAEALAAYQAQKRAYKAQLRAEGRSYDPSGMSSGDADGGPTTA